MSRTPLLALLAAALAGGCGSSESTPDTSSSAPAKRAGFTAQVTNPWFPLRPGSVYRYRGVKDGKPSREVVTVTHRTKTIDGAPTVVVSDRLYIDGVLEERTSDYYSQDAHGTVWYFGEDTAELDPNGKVTTREGTWHSGRDGAKPGIFMYAAPRVGQSARQEYLKGNAEDHFAVVATGRSVTVPFRRFGGVLLTKEWTPLEPGVLDHKYYARGIGTVLEQTVKGGDERNELVSFHH
jgi:hypothetical protein